MFWALDPITNNRVKAEPGLKAVCPGCKWPVVAKCGTLYLWHWAHLQRNKHKVGQDCDPWAEKESEWHFNWKMRVPEHMREYVIKRNVVAPNGTPLFNIDGSSLQITHRADILNSRGTVIELQHSPISLQDIKNRESFYENMIWIFDCTSAIFENPERLDEGHRYIWKHYRKQIHYCRKPVFLHLGAKKLFRVITIANRRPVYVTGRYESFDDFLEIYFV